MTSLPSEGLNLLDEEDAETWAVPGQYIQLTDDADTPARRAGLENGDLIIQVNGSRVLGLGHDAVVNHLAGVGNNFTLELGTWPVSVFVCVFKFPHFDGVLLRNCLKTIPSLFFFPFPIFFFLSFFLSFFLGCGRGIGRRGDTTGPNFKHRVADVLSTLMDRDATNRPDYVTDPMDVLPRWFPKSEMKDDPIFKPATIPASVQPTPRTITSYHHPVYINTSYHHPVYINTPYHQHLDTSYQHLVYPHLPRTNTSFVSGSHTTDTREMVLMGREAFALHPCALGAAACCSPPLLTSALLVTSPTSEGVVCGTSLVARDGLCVGVQEFERGCSLYLRHLDKLLQLCDGCEQGVGCSWRAPRRNDQHTGVQPSTLVLRVFWVDFCGCGCGGYLFNKHSGSCHVSNRAQQVKGGLRRLSGAAGKGAACKRGVLALGVHCNVAEYVGKGISAPRDFGCAQLGRVHRPRPV